MVGNVRQKIYDADTVVEYRPHHDRPSFTLARQKRRRGIVSCREALGRQCEYKEGDAYCIRDGGHNCNAQVENGHNDTILNRPFHISNSTILICLKHVCHGTFTHHKPASLLPHASHSGVIPFAWRLHFTSTCLSPAEFRRNKVYLSNMTLHHSLGSHLR